MLNVRPPFEQDRLRVSHPAIRFLGSGLAVDEMQQVDEIRRRGQDRVAVLAGAEVHRAEQVLERGIGDHAGGAPGGRSQGRRPEHLAAVL
jgi:hypothetical protein